MIHAPKETRKINKFVFTIIPSIRDLFYRYGNMSNQGSFSCAAGEFSDPAQPSPSSVIDQMIYAQRLSESAALYEEHKDKL